MSRRKICVLTGTRAEYGLLYWLMKEIQNDPELELQIIATGMHLSPEFGLTYKVIEEDGFVINEKIEMLLSSDTPVGIAKSIGLATIGFADALERLKPDILVLLGDRFEILAAAQAALVARIPVAHIAGGDITEGAFDDAIRHCVTKMAHLHFVTNELAARRVRQLGEDVTNIFNIGSPAIDNIKRLSLLNKEQLEKKLGFKLRSKNLLITFHPVTLDNIPSEYQLSELLRALGEISTELSDDIGLVFTSSNADPSGRGLNSLIGKFVNEHSNAVFHTSLGQLVYLSTIAHVDAVVGNSSSGIYEVPSFKKPTVNIGDRQKGRLLAASVINCQPKAEEIKQAVFKALVLDCSHVVNPYGKGDSSWRIVNILKSIHNYNSLLKKRFYEVF
ncbi:UDP-N-acetylglucosamine 2-epimerase (non-hydrolysing) [Desulforamulus putei DSM 12395]|uniref:UDP-N-acetylglucosamine 2-epimerase (Non-hydrolysing) n=2 Tax=Desulforamulus putei TaxID=74701 RepID=A0A1M5AY82_9FIRM|nr:UDP-N-acetylglucosamine 2-epimerase (non-hydrolysing) [Desulforamulus putei DSM 12395]